MWTTSYDQGSSVEENGMLTSSSELWLWEMSRDIRLYRLVVVVFVLLTVLCTLCTLYIPLKNALQPNPSSSTISKDCHFILTPGNCMLPFPCDNLFSQNNSSTCSIVAGANKGNGPKLPRFRFRQGWDADWLTQLDFGEGFSRLSPIVFSLENLNPADLVDYDHVHLSLEDNSTTILIDATTGERAAHFYSSSHFFDALDPFAAVAMHPAQPLIEGHRYIFGVRNVRNRKNPSMLAPIPKGFQIIRDNQTADNSGLGSLFHHFGYAQWQEIYHRDIFPVLNRHGFAPLQLLLAWQFTVKSKNATLHSANIIRSTLHSLFSSTNNESVQVELDDVREFKCKPISKNRGWFRKIHGQVSNVPLFLEQDRPGTKLSHPLRQTGTTVVPFTVLLPCSLSQTAGTQATMLLQYGHGLMGSQGEAQSDYLERMANEYNLVVWAVDWRGMSQYDIPCVFKMLLMEPDHFAMIPHNVLQGFVDATVVLWKVFLSNAFREWDAMHIDDTPVLPSFASIDGNSFSIGYYGNSQGGILGAALIAFSPFYVSGVLGVGGAPYSLLISQSIDAIPYIRALQVELSSRDLPLYASWIQQWWDIGEPTGWLSTLIDEEKYVLLHVAIQDRQVPIAGGEVLGRGLNATLMGPKGRVVFGLPKEKTTWLSPHSQMVEWSVATEADFAPHECVRRARKQIIQSMEFLFSRGYVFQICPSDCRLSQCT
ncbi:hypothetical protein GAYE_SCF40G5410 [Galdieria yellowstonensis]|uniref:Uncharacterized protein n=1 Tax=Galdieria yellowstonensis TaxID=3028027 RepID=A0AAV9IJT6_9RHOD|nr:hypothetical protein GAYE_SCF40G5410 [Galdieria yellowstonensis]